MSTWVWVDGNLAPAGEARVAALDHGLTVGDGVFETCKVVDGTPFALTRHLARLHRSAEIIGLRLPWSDDALRAACAETVGAAEIDAANAATGVTRLRITVTGGPAPLGSERGDTGPTVIVAMGALRAFPPTESVVVVPWTRNEHGATAGLKTISYAENVRALAFAHAQGASEAVFANTRGDLCEATGSNVFVVERGVVRTPPADAGCLLGVTRALVIEACAAEGVPCEEVPVTMDAFRAADEAFLTSSTREVQAIRSVDGVDLPVAPGPVTARLRDAFRALVASGTHLS